MSYFQNFPNTNFYNQDIGWLIKKYKELNGDVKILQQIYDMIKEQIKDITIKQLQQWLDDGTLENLIANLGKLVRYYDSTYELINSNEETGGIYITKCYQTKGDNGGGCILISESILNGYVYFSNGNKYYILLDSKITPEKLGYNYDITDVFSKLKTCNYTKPLFLNDKEYTITTLIDCYNSIIGYNSTIIMESSPKSKTYLRVNKNVYFENINFKTEADQLHDDDGFELGTYKHDYIWSNIIGISLYNAITFTCNNCTFENFEYPILKLDGVQTKKISLKNIEYINCVNPINISRCDLLTVDNCEIDTALDSTKLCHSIYISYLCNEAYINNCRIYGGVGPSLHPYSLNDYTPKKISFNNLNIYSPLFFASNLENVIINNCNYESTNNDPKYNLLELLKPRKFIFRNSTFKSAIKGYLFTNDTADMTIEIDNCIFENIAYNRYGSANPNVTINNCKMSVDSGYVIEGNNTTKRTVFNNCILQSKVKDHIASINNGNFSFIGCYLVNETSQSLPSINIGSAISIILINNIYNNYSSFVAGDPTVNENNKKGY